MISVMEADRLLEQHMPRLPLRTVALAEATGAVLAEDVRADRPLPPFDRVAMDGVAVRFDAVSAGVRRFHIEGRQRAGEPAGVLLDGHGCIEAMTGAVLPAGADTVLRLEDLTFDEGVAVLAPEAAPRPSMHVHARGSDRPAGAVLVRAGARLNAARIGIAAAVGRRTLRVGGRPRIGIVSTGDELVDVGVAPAGHQIRRSNAYAIRAALAAAGLHDHIEMHLPDDEEVLRDRIGALLPAVDVLVISGGVSRGRFDFVPAVLTDLGVNCRFHGISQKPGKPFWFGTTGDSRCAVFGLPGNPVSALVCTYRYLLPALRRACSVPGAESTPCCHAVLEMGVRPAPAAGATLFVPVTVRADAGRLLAAAVPGNGSGDFCALATTDGFVEAGAGSAAAGSVIPFYDWRT
jgi:molybdopterin molybdotransferase